MKLKMQLKSLAFVYNLINSGNGYILPSDKPLFLPSEQTANFPEAIPEQEGVRSSGLLDMFASLSADRKINPHSAIVLRNGKLIAKADWAPYRADLPHVSHSLAKSVASMAVGIAVKEKYISVDERLGDFFDTAKKSVREITIHELLTMSSGVKFNEAGSLTSKNWVESYLASDVLFEHGTDFHYNSMNSYMLSAALCKRTGLSLSEYISRRLFTPMGIEKFFWEKCPSGIEKGGWGLYLTVYDYAKLGQLWLENGIWNGAQLVPQEWVRTASSLHISHKELCTDGYGYQMWMGKHGVIFSGMFGQLVYIVPKEKMVIALTAGSENLFPCGYALDYINAFLSTPEYFSKSPFTRFHYAESASLRKALASSKFGSPLELSNKNNLFARLKQLFVTNTTSPENVLNGVEIIFKKNRGHILPLLIQIMEGCFDQGIEEISFLTEDEHLNMKISFKDTSAIIPLGFTASASCMYKGYAIAAQAFFTTDEDEMPVLKIQLCFLESSCTKILKFIFDDEGVTLKIRESPKLYCALDEISALASPQLGANIRRTIEAVLETDIADYKIKSFIEPTISGSFKLSTSSDIQG